MSKAPGRLILHPKQPPALHSLLVPEQCPPRIWDSPLLPKEGITAMLGKPLITSSGKLSPGRDHGGSKPTSHHSTDVKQREPRGSKQAWRVTQPGRAGGVQVPHPQLPVLATGGWIITELLSCQICPPPPLSGSGSGSQTFAPWKASSLPTLLISCDL